MFQTRKIEPRETLAWSRDVTRNTARSVWDRITKRNDDDDDMPGPNAGATAWVPLFSGGRKTTTLAF